MKHVVVIDTEDHTLSRMLVICSEVCAAIDAAIEAIDCGAFEQPVEVSDADIYPV